MAGSEIDSHIHRYVISTKVQRQLSGKKDSFFLWSWNDWISIYRKEKFNFDPYATSYTKINSKWIIDLNIKPKTVKPLEEILCDPGLGKYLSEHQKHSP